MKTNRAQLRAGRYKQIAEIWRYTFSHSDKFGQPLYTWHKLKSIRCFIDDMKGTEHFDGDFVAGKENYYFEFRFTDINTHDQLRFTDNFGRNLILNTTSVVPDDEGKRFIRVLCYVLSPNEAIANPNTYINFSNSPTNIQVANPNPTGGVTPVKPIPHTNKDLPHVISSDVVLTNHNKLDIIMDKEIFIKGDLTKAIKIHIGTKLITPTSAIKDTSNNHRIEIEIPDTIKAGDQVTWSYVDNVTDVYIFAKRKDASEAHFENQTFGVTNGIVAMVHTLDMMSATISKNDPTKIVITFNKDPHLPTTNTIGLTLKVNGKVIPITNVYENNKDIIITNATKFYKTDIVTLEHSGDTLVVEKDNHAIKWSPVALFTVTNLSTVTKPAVVPPIVHNWDYLKISDNFLDDLGRTIISFDAGIEMPYHTDSSYMTIHDTDAFNVNAYPYEIIGNNLHIGHKGLRVDKGDTLLLKIHKDIVIRNRLDNSKVCILKGGTEISTIMT